MAAMVEAMMEAKQAAYQIAAAAAAWQSAQMTTGQFLQRVADVLERRTQPKKP
jgi:hypothetical protein